MSRFLFSNRAPRSESETNSTVKASLCSTLVSLFVPSVCSLMAESACPPITVEGDWSSAQNRTVATKLQVYFGSKRKSGGGECRVEADSGAPRAAVFFSSAEGEEPPPRHLQSLQQSLQHPNTPKAHKWRVGEVRCVREGFGGVFRTRECGIGRTQFTASPEIVQKLIVGTATATIDSSERL